MMRSGSMSWRDRGYFGMPPEREDPDWTDTMQVCERGHVITDMAVKYPDSQKKRCPECGAATLLTCKKCGNPIPGHEHCAGIVSVYRAPRPDFCQNCGDPHPWTGKENPETAGEDVASRPATEHVLPFEVVKGTRRYLEQVVNQA